MRIKQLAKVLMTVFLGCASALSSDGDLDLSFNAGVVWRGAAVFDFARQRDGKIVIGGNFTVVDGRSYNCVARLNADGSLDGAFNIGRGAGFNSVGCNGEVRAVAVQPDGKILVGGAFSTFGDTGPTELRSYLARLNPDGSLDGSFIGLVPGSGPSGEIDDIAVQPDGKILIASFNTTQYDGVSVGYFARLNENGSLDTDFNTNLQGGFDTSTKTIELQSDGKILVGGPFTQVGTHAASHLARLNSDGTFDDAFTTNGGTGPSNGVLDIVVQADGRILICGLFDEFNGATAHRIARLDSSGAYDASFVSPVAVNSPIESLAIDRVGRILAAGGSAYFDDGIVQRNAIARLSANGSVDPIFSVGVGTNGPITVIGLQGNDLLVAGGYTLINGKSQLSFSRLLPSGIVNADFEPVIGLPGTVNAIEIQPDGKILVGGDFYGANSALRQRLTRLKPDGTTDTSFFPGQGEGDFDMAVDAIAVQPNGKILVGGNFNNFGGVPNTGFVRLNSDGSIDNTFSASTFGVRSIAVQADGKIVIGGYFNAVNGVSGHNRIARLNPDGSIDNTFVATGAPCNCGVEKVLVQADGKILVGGYFDEFNGVNGINNMVRLTTTGATDAPFTVNGGTGFSGTVYDIDIQPADGKILVTGWFNGYSTFTSPGVARLLPTGEFDALFNVGTGFNGVSPVTLALDRDGGILVGGYFAEYRGIFRPRIVRITPEGAIDPTFNPVTYPNEGVRAIAVQSSGSIIIGGEFTHFGDQYGTPRIGIARLQGGNFASFRAPFDFDGDGRTDISIFRPNDGTWWLNRSRDGNLVQSFGISTDTPVPADWSGDGTTDIAVYRSGPPIQPGNPDAGYWWILRSEDSTFYSFQFGYATDTPVPADYDGDGSADAAVFRESTGTWFIQTSGGTIIQQFGIATDKPVVADYDGDSKADIAVFRPNGPFSEWYILESSNGNVEHVVGGWYFSDVAVPGDWDGDGRSEITLYLTGYGFWQVRRDDGSWRLMAQLGALGDIPVPGDYDGDGKTDVAVYRPSDGTWHIQYSRLGFTATTQYGLSGDFPVPSSYIR